MGVSAKLSNSSLNPLNDRAFGPLVISCCASQIQHFPIEKAIGQVSVNAGSGAGCALLHFHATASDEPVLL